MKNLGTTKLLKGLCFATMLAGPLAFAETQEYVWQNGNFQSAAACDVKSVDETRLQVFEETNSLRDLRALVRVDESGPSFKIVSISREQDSQEARDFVKSERLSTSKNKDLGDFVLKIFDSSKKKIGSSGVALSGAHLQAASEGDDFVVFDCGSKGEFLAFDVFTAANPSAVARVGVSLQDLTLFRSVQILPVDEAEENLNKEQAKLQEKGQLPAPRQVDFRRTGGSTPSSLESLHEKRENNQMQTAQKTAPDAKVVKPVSAIANVRVVEGDLEQIVCSSRPVSVLNNDLSQTLFQASNGDAVHVVQSFGNDRQTKQSKTYVKVSIKDQAGWIDASALKVKSDCSVAVLPDQAPVPPARPEQTPQDIKNAAETAENLFPTIKRPNTSYRTAQRRFKAGRKKGRLHAACDLYRPRNEKTQAVGAGKVIRKLSYFYEGTYSIELRLTDGRIARYGEVTGKAASGTAEGKSVKAGQNMGYVGKVNSGCCAPMLHFEMYKGTVSGPLTQKWRKGFQRRSDLFDPTAQLQKWEKQTFGASY